MITGSFKDAEYRNGMRRLQKALNGPSFAVIIREEARLFFKELLRVIPPKNQTQGRRAVAQDLAKIVVQREPGYLQFVSKNFGKKQVRQELKTKKGVTYLIEFDEISFDPARLAAHHKASRLKSGRVTNAGQGDRTIGRWRSRNAIWTTPKIYRRYLRSVQARVGMFKARFAFAYYNLGGQVPKWIQRHFAPLAGTFKNQLRHPTNPHLKLRVEGYNLQKFQSAIDFTLRRRINTLARKADNIIKDAWRKG